MGSLIEPLLPNFLYLFPAPCVLFGFGWFMVRENSFRSSYNLWLPFTWLLAIWLVIASFVSLDFQSSRQWSAAFIIGYLLVASRAQSMSLRNVFVFERGLMISGFLIGCLSITEWVTSQNLVHNVIGSDNGLGAQRWSIFRSYATFSHPLVASTFLASICAFCTVKLVTHSSPHSRWFVGVCAAVSGAGMVFTGSRSSAVALGLGVLIALIGFAIRHGFSLAKSFLMIGAGISVGIYLTFFSIFSERSRSVEGGVSADARNSILTVTTELLRTTQYLGSGPGTAQRAATRSGFRLFIESSLAQTFISIGLIGTFLLAVVVLYPVFAGWAAGNFAGVAAVVCFLGSSVAFTLWETNPSSFLFLGLLTVPCWFREPVTESGGRVRRTMKPDTRGKVRTSV
ncbi:hypothetical protein HQO82_08635 [Rhodococcus fascians]|nr:hypothetical protein [Rhodococcus fascians]MBY4113887.1 hypothetical protein [Rhodococcus fascians]